MNKKFSTLLASALLATTVGASAQIAPTPTTNGGFAKYKAAPTADVNNAEKGLVQLGLSDVTTGTQILAMVPDGTTGKYKLVVTTENSSSPVEVRYTLWKVVADTDGVSGYKYQYQNVGTGELLAFNTDEATAYKADATLPTTLTATAVGSEVASWTWLDVPAKAKDAKFVFNDKVALASTFKSDSVLTLAGVASLGDAVDIVAVKYSNKNKPTSVTNQIVAVPYAPAGFVLGVNDLNSLLWKQDATTGKLKLVFNPEAKNNKFENLFSKNEYTAVPAVGYPAAVGSGENPFNTGSSYIDAVVTAENALANKKLQIAWINKLLEVSMTSDVVVADKLAAMDAAVKLLNAEAVNAGSLVNLTDKEKIIEAINKIKFADNDQAAAVKAQALAYVNGFQGAEKDIVTSMNGAINEMYAFYSSDDSSYGNAFATGTKKADVIKKIDETFATKGLETAVTSAKTAASATFTETAEANGWVSLMYKKDATDAAKNTYLAVDQKYITTIGGHRDLGFKIGTFGDAGYTADTKARLDLNGRYNFQFTYFPNADSLDIRTAGWAKAKDGQAWKDMNAVENTDLGADQTTDGNNIVKLTYLTDTHSEITLGLEEKNGLKTINTRISLLDVANTYVKTTLPSGVYFFNFFTEAKDEMVDNGKYAIANFNGSNMYWATPENNYALGIVQEYKNMPRTQWVVVQNKGAEGTQTVSIYNREYPQFKAERVQLYKAGENVFAVRWGSNIEIAADDTLSYTKLVADNGKIGYKAMANNDALVDNVFALRYFNGLNAGNLVEVTKDKAMFVNPEVEITEATQFVFVPSKKDEKYGYDNKLIRNSYNVKVQSTDLYLKDNGKDGYTLTDKDHATAFYFKENNGYTKEEEGKDAEWVSYYAVVKLTGKGENKADQGTVSGVKHPSLVVSVEEIDTENSIATFAFEDALKYQYRRLGKTVTDEFADKNVNIAKFFRTNDPSSFLYENSANRTAENGDPILNFLGEINKADRPESAMLPIFVDTAYVRGETTKPLYMLAVGTDWKEGKPAEPCQYDHDHGFDKDGNALDKWTCSHATKATPSYRTGRYLVGLSDSAAVEPIQYQNNYRLAFVDAKHIADTLVITSSKYTGSKDFAGNDSIVFADKKVNAATFALKLVDPTSDNGDFYMETSTASPANEYKGETRYVRVHNGVPVLVSELSEAAMFNVIKTDEAPVANEGIEASTISVVTTSGAVIVKGAEGKTVTITNVLGQTIANTVLSSDEATIAAPKGYVTVAVEGEAAVKAIVK